MLYFVMFAVYMGLGKFVVPSSCQKFNHMRRRLSIASWSEPDSPECHGHGTVFISNALEFLSAYRAKTGQDIKLSQLLIKVATDSYSEYNDMNGRISFGCFVPNIDVDATLITPLDGGKNIGYTHLRSCNKKLLREVVGDCSTKQMPLYDGNSVNIPSNIANLLMYLPTGLSTILLEVISYVTVSMGIDLPGISRHPFGTVIIIDCQDLLSDILYPAILPFFRAPIISILSSTKEIPTVQDNKIVSQKAITLTFTGDHRFGDGTRAIKAMNDMKKRLENPQNYYKIE